MTSFEPLTLALADAATAYVAKSKVGTRRGSVAAVAAAMTERGVELSKNTLQRRLNGEYPFNTDEIAAMAAVIGVDPDDIWREALAKVEQFEASNVVVLQQPAAPESTVSPLAKRAARRVPRDESDA